MTTKLYYSAGACSLAVHIALRKVGAQFDLTAVDLTKHLITGGTDFYMISPRGYVSLLELTDGSRHIEGAALLQYVADLDPTQTLIGKPGSVHRLAVIEWPVFVGTELHRGSGLFWHKNTPEATRQGAKDKPAKCPVGLDTRLAKQSYLADTYDVAGAYVFAVLSWMSILALPMGAYLNVQAYMVRVATWLHVVEALTTEGLIKASKANEASAIA